MSHGWDADSSLRTRRAGHPYQLGRAKDDLGPCVRAKVPQRTSAWLSDAFKALPGLTAGRVAQLDPSSTRLVLTEPVFNLPNVQDQYDQIIFEEYDFGAAAKCPGLSSASHDRKHRRSPRESQLPHSSPSAPSSVSLHQNACS